MEVTVNRMVTDGGYCVQTGLQMEVTVNTGYKWSLLCSDKVRGGGGGYCTQTGLYMELIWKDVVVREMDGDVF